MYYFLLVTVRYLYTRDWKVKFSFLNIKPDLFPSKEIGNSDCLNGT
jgi:hypothetical protein